MNAHQLTQHVIDEASAEKDKRISELEMGWSESVVGLESEIVRLQDDLESQTQTTAFACRAHEQARHRIDQLTDMLEESMRIFALYLNVPESRALQERWDSLKNAP